MPHDIRVYHYLRYMVLTSATTLDNTRLGNDRPWSVIRMHCSYRSVLAQDPIGKETSQNLGCVSRAPRWHSVHGPRWPSYSQDRREYTEQVQPRPDLWMIMLAMFGLVLFCPFRCWSRSPCMLLFSPCPSPVFYLCPHRRPPSRPPRKDDCYLDEYIRVRRQCLGSIGNQIT